MAETQLICCPSCGETNRVPMDRLASGLTPVCGRCKTRMPIESKPVIVSDATFSTEVEARRCRCWSTCGLPGADRAG